MICRPIASKRPFQSKRRRIAYQLRDCNRKELKGIAQAYQIETHRWWTRGRMFRAVVNGLAPARATERAF